MPAAYHLQLDDIKPLWIVREFAQDGTQYAADKCGNWYYLTVRDEPAVFTRDRQGNEYCSSPATCAPIWLLCDRPEGAPEIG